MELAASQLLRPGQILAGKYRIERFLAQGGHAAVFVAEQLATEARVAVKVLWPHMHSSDVAARFELEAKVAARVKSDAIVRTLDAGFDADRGLLYLVMELLDGLPLDRFVAEHGPLSATDAVTYVLQLADGLDKAHNYVGKDGAARPIIHRDLKPANLFLCKCKDGHSIVKILDFGIAKIVSDSGVASRDIHATPMFMAVEQASGELVGPWTDVWALGMIVFFLLTGRNYWKATESVSSIVAQVLHSPIEPPTERALQFGLKPTWQLGFDTWFLRCVNRDASARFQSAGAAATSLAESLLGGMWSATLPRGVWTDSEALRSSEDSRPFERERLRTFTHGPTAPAQQPRKLGRLVAVLALASAIALGVGVIWWSVKTKPTVRTGGFVTTVTAHDSRVKREASAPSAPSAQVVPAESHANSRQLPAVLPPTGGDMKPSTTARAPSKGPRAPISTARTQPRRAAMSNVPVGSSRIYDER